MSRNARSSRLPSRIAVVPATRWAHSAHARAVSVAYTAATRMSARNVGVSSSPAATADSALVNASSTSSRAARQAATWCARPFWNVGRLASDAMSLIRYFVAASSSTSSSMLLATPSAHAA